jgi:O-antigen ligase
MYFFFTGSIRWDRVPKGYLAWSGLAVGCVVLLQLLENYLSGRIFDGSSIDRELIATGWGMHNNIGCMMAVMMPFGFYLASKAKHSWLFNILGTVLLLGTMLSCSRTSMMMAMLGYVVCAVLLLKNPKTRKSNLWVYLVALATVLVAVVIFADKIFAIFERFFSQMGNVSQRDNLISYGFRQFLSEPIFGGSFYPQGEYVPWDWSNLESFSSFFPPRWHSTVIQILASCGAVGITAYAIHRFQTLKLFWKNRSHEKTYIGISLAVLLLASLMDCHFFNIGPVLFYSMALAFVEKMPGEESELANKKGN